MNEGIAENADPRIPLTLLTGFLGSGKTTLLRRLLEWPELADTAVIINELGEIGLDHLLVEHVAPDLQVLRSGCLCCTLRGDLAQTLAALQARRAAGELRFSRVIVETTGLADPAPVLHTLAAEEALARHYRLAGVVTTVDAVNADATLTRHAEARRQVAMADVLLLTKTDLVPARAAAAIGERLARFNPAAPQTAVLDGRIAAAAVLGDIALDPLAAFRWREAAGVGPIFDGGHGTHAQHDHAIRAHCFTIDEPLDAQALAHWLELLAAMRGERLLRFKGLVCAAAHPQQPLVLHGAQHVIHPPQRLARWPSDDQRSRLVFITHAIERGELERTLRKFAGVSPLEALT